MFGLSMVFLMTRRPPRSTRTDTRVPHTPLCRSDGRIIPPAMLRELLASRGGTGWLLVDEAFADFDPALSIAPAVNDDARLILFRSFGKFFGFAGVRSEEHTSELQSLMRISYAVFCLKKKKSTPTQTHTILN